MKIKILAFFSLLVSFFSNAQTKVNNSLLYKVSGNGIKEPSYIFGTFHMMCEGDFEITPTFETALKSTKQLYEELKMDDPTMLLKAMTLMKSDSSLEVLLGEEKFKLLNQKCKDILGMSAAMYNNFKPMMITSSLSLKMIDCDKTVQPETEILNFAKSNGAAVFGLETIETQMNALNTTSLKKQADDVYKMIANVDSTKIMMRNLLNTYKKRDINALYNFMKEADTNEVFENNLLTKRNLNWIPIMEKAMKEMPTFFAVGSGHLGGENGVINLLLKQGYTLEPIKY